MQENLFTCTSPKNGRCELSSGPKTIDASEGLIFIDKAQRGSGGYVLQCKLCDVVFVVLNC